jgi:hypothetical protein
MRRLFLSQFLFRESRDGFVFNVQLEVGASDEKQGMRFARGQDQERSVGIEAKSLGL